MVSPRPPSITWDLVAGGELSDLYPTFRAAVATRLSSNERITPFAALEVGVFGSGYRRNVQQIRPGGGPGFNAPAFFGGPAVALGARVAPNARVLVSGSGGLAMIETSAGPGRFLDVNLSVEMGSQLALLAGIRHMWYRDVHVDRDRTHTPVVIGLRLLRGR